MDPFGRLVDEGEAHTLVEDYKALRDLLIDEILPLLPPDAAEAVKNSATFHKSKANCFVFDAALIQGLFVEPQAATHFAVFLAADGSTQTVVVAGLREGAVQNTLKASPDKPPPEHPKGLIGVKYPSDANGAIPITPD